MSRQSLLRGIRDGRLRDLARAARKQNFELGQTRSDHLYLQCPACPARITFSKTVPSRDFHAYRTVLNLLRKHGLTYDGRDGAHTADLPRSASAAP
ncbi:hypothetical protein ACFRK5_21400 [Streptomyces niveus]|uniref:hypothetical protein n=1 Tax=Streptomyces niveus TaxID=193462 RepID=UPI00368E46AC